MTELRWTKETTFADHGHNFVARGEGVYDVPEEVVEDYLDHQSGGWERPDGSDESDDSDASTATSESDDSGDEFDAESFAADSWQSVTSAIEDGEADDNLDAVREAEESRDSPRDSVLDALDERQSED